MTNEALLGRLLDPERAEAVLRDSLSVTGTGEMVVTGTCMEPALRAGAPVALRAASRGGIGDIILFRAPGGLRLHRIVWRSGELLRTKGDRGAALDPPLALRSVIATADAGEPRLLAFTRAAGSIARVALARIRAASVTRVD